MRDHLSANTGRAEQAQPPHTLAGTPLPERPGGEGLDLIARESAPRLCACGTVLSTDRQSLARAAANGALRIADLAAAGDAVTAGDVAAGVSRGVAEVVG